MTADQFKAWFEGFAEALGGPPSAEQWEKVRQKVASMGGFCDPLGIPPLTIPTISYPNTNTPLYRTPYVTSSSVRVDNSFPYSESETVQ